MATNPYISKKVRSEQSLYEDLVIESLKFYGEDVYYIPREIVNKDKIFADDVPSRFTDAYKIETYIENTEGFDGEGDLFTKFGIELRDQATFVFARRRWKKLIGDNLAEVGFRPREGDIIYLPMSNSMFEVMKVETETPFYQLSQLPTFRLQCELFEYSDEDFDTNIASIDAIEYEGAYQYKLTMESPLLTSVQIEADDGSIDLGSGAIGSFNITNGGKGYVTAPTPTVSVPTSDITKFGVNSLNANNLQQFTKSHLFTSDNGTVECFVYPEQLPSSGRQEALFAIGGDVEGDTNSMVFGINEDGKLIYSFSDALGGESKHVLTSSQISVNQWTHIVIGVDSNGSGQMSQLFGYANGIKVLDSDVNRNLNLVGDLPSSVGASALRIYNGEFYRKFEGRIDEYRVLTGSRTDLETPRLTTDSSYDFGIVGATGQYTLDADQFDRSGVVTDLSNPTLNMYLGDTLTLNQRKLQVSPQLGFIMLGSFGGAVVSGNTFTFPTGAEDWAGFLNANDGLYPIGLDIDSYLRFRAYVPSGGSVDVRFRFEFQSFPDTEPSYDTASVTISGDTENSYEVYIPAQNESYTYSNFIMYVETRDEPVYVQIDGLYYTQPGQHPLQIEDSAGSVVVAVQDSDGTGTTSTVFSPTYDGSYYYQCTNHANMRGQIIVEDIDLEPVTSAFDSNSNTALLEHFEGERAVLTTSITDGVVTSVTIVDSGQYYTSSPTITVPSHLDSSDFLIGETVTQTNSNYTIKGEVTRWSDSDRILQLAHVGTTDGTFNTFTTNTVRVVGETSGGQWVPTLVGDVQEIQPVAQNKIFDDFEGDFLDFSESNPFGDMF